MQGVCKAASSIIKRNNEAILVEVDYDVSKTAVTIDYGITSVDPDCKLSCVVVQADPANKSTIFATMTDNVLTYPANELAGYDEQLKVQCSNIDSPEVKGTKLTIDKQVNIVQKTICVRTLKFNGF